MLPPRPLDAERHPRPRGRPMYGGPRCVAAGSALDGPSNTLVEALSKTQHLSLSFMIITLKFREGAEKCRETSFPPLDVVSMFFVTFINLMLQAI